MEPSRAAVARSQNVVALCRARLGKTRAGRIGRASVRLLTAGFAVAAIALRVADGAEASISGLTVTAAPWVAWIAGGALAFHAAGDRAAADCREGIEALAAARGAPSAGLDARRVLAA